VPNPSVVPPEPSSHPQDLAPFVEDLLPIVRARARRVLARSLARRVEARDVFQEVDELTQEVFAMLLSSNAFRAWDPTRGLSFPNFVGLLAEREMLNILDSTRRRPWHARETEGDWDHLSDGRRGPEAEVGARELADFIFVRLRRVLSPSGQRIFQLLVLEERDVDDVCALLGLSAGAVYTWRCRITKLVREVADQAA
jgi:RNA polymerase sigma factor (sigma-70 family)